MALIQQAEQVSWQVPISEAAEWLQLLLSRRLVAYIAGVDSGLKVTEWIENPTAEISKASNQRLRLAYEIGQLLTQSDDEAVVRAWFVGLNPQLGDVSPAEAIHAGRLEDVRAASRAFMTGG